MGRIYESIDEHLQGWIDRQPMFFVATAPNDVTGHVNVSPKGGVGTFRTLGPASFAYLDLVGSGIETVAHLRENGRIVVMFCAFDGPPKIVRLHGTGRAILPGDGEFENLVSTFAPNAEHLATLRGVIVVDVSRISDSCGFVVPTMDYIGERDQLYRSAEVKAAKIGPAWKTEYAREKNTESIDGLPGLVIDDDLPVGQRAAPSRVAVH